MSRPLLGARNTKEGKLHARDVVFLGVETPLGR